MLCGTSVWHALAFSRVGDGEMVRPRRVRVVHVRVLLHVRGLLLHLEFIVAAVDRVRAARLLRREHGSLRHGPVRRRTAHRRRGLLARDGRGVVVLHLRVVAVQSRGLHGVATCAAGRVHRWLHLVRMRVLVR